MMSLRNTLTTKAIVDGLRDIHKRLDAKGRDSDVLEEATRRVMALGQQDKETTDGRQRAVLTRST